MSAQPNQIAPIKPQGNLFQRAAALAPLAPIERAVLKVLTSLVGLVPATVITGVITWALTFLHTYLPIQAVSLLEIALSAIFLGVAKYVSAQGDTALGDLLAQLAGAAQKDASKGM